MPLDLRKYLLATGERGLGMAYVERLDAYTFERLWVMMQLVAQASTDDGRKALELDLGVDTVEAIEAGEEQPVDPSTMTQEELQAWAEKWYSQYYSGGE